MKPDNIVPSQKGQQTVALLEQLDGYIRNQARQTVPHGSLSGDTLDLDIDEIAQITRIKLWETLIMREQVITNPRAYARSIVHNEAMNMARSRKRLLPLSVDEQGELTGEYLAYLDGEGQQDPAYTIEQAEQLTETTTEATNAIRELPPQQRQALVCSLQDRIDDVLSLVEPLRTHDIDIMAAHWPVDKIEQHRLKASLSVAHNKLRHRLKGRAGP